MPCLLENLKSTSNNIKTRIIDILVTMLTKTPDFNSRQRIHAFLNENLASSKSIYDRKVYLLFCAKIAPKISKKYYKEVFAWHFLKISEEKKKEIKNM